MEEGSPPAWTRYLHAQRRDDSLEGQGRNHDDVAEGEGHKGPRCHHSWACKLLTEGTRIVFNKGRGNILGRPNT